jgi:5-methylcytosine-specific restriction enzyme A
LLQRSNGGHPNSDGILPKARVVSLPQERADDESTKHYWQTDDWVNPYLAVKLEDLNVKLEEGFINKLSLFKHPFLKKLLILKLG